MQPPVISDDEDLVSPPSSDIEQDWSEEDDDIPLISTGLALFFCTSLVAKHLQ